MSPVYPISVLFQTLSWHNFPCPGRHTILSIYYCCSWWAWIKGLNTPSFRGDGCQSTVHSNLRARTADMTYQVWEVPAWGAAGSRSGRWGTAWSLRRAEGQETPCTFQSLSELCWQLDGAEKPGGSEGTVCSPALRLLSRRNSSVMRKPVSVHTRGFPHPDTKSTALRNDRYVCPAFQARAGFHTQPNSGEG